MSVHLHCCIPIKVWFRRRWLCVRCDNHFPVDVDGWSSSARGRMAYQTQDVYLTNLQSRGIHLVIGKPLRRETIHVSHVPDHSQRGH